MFLPGFLYSQEPLLLFLPPIFTLLTYARQTLLHLDILLLWGERNVVSSRGGHRDQAWQSKGFYTLNKCNHMPDHVYRLVYLLYKPSSLMRPEHRLIHGLFLQTFSRVPNLLFNISNQFGHLKSSIGLRSGSLAYNT